MKDQDIRNYTQIIAMKEEEIQRLLPKQLEKFLNVVDLLVGYY